MFLKPKESARSSPPTVSSTSPTDNTNGIISSTNIKIEFKNNLSQEKRQLISYNLSPTTPANISWNESELIINPLEILKFDSEYKVEILFQNKPIYNFTFKTKSEDDLTDEDSAQLVNKGDRLYNEALAEDSRQNPWKKYFPIITNEYTIIYAPSEDAYIVDVLSETDEQTILSIKIKAQEKIRNLNVPTKKIIYLE